MLSVLLLALSSLQGFSQAELRTLRFANESLQLSAQVATVQQNCPALDLATMFGATLPTKDELSQLLQRTLDITMDEYIALQQTHQGLRALSGSALPTPTCSELEPVQDLLADYQTQLTALELALPMPDWQLKLHPTEHQQAPILTVNELSQSHAIVVAKVIERASLTAMQQANYLHIDYQSPYIFQLEHGWRAVVPRFIGMHLNVESRQRATTADRWLLLLNRQFQITKAVPLSTVKTELAVLGRVDWSFNAQGDLQR